MRTVILKLGYEIEGEFDPTFADNMKTEGSIGGDGSVNTCPEGHKFSEDFMTAEFKSKPTPIKKVESLTRILALFQQAYKLNAYHWNKSAGFHIHFSFKPKIPCELWSMQFQKYFHTELQKKFPEVLGLRRRNRYCKVVNSEEEIAFSDNRYKSINFLGAMKKHGTIEFRIFPADEPIKMQEYMLFTIKTIQKFLKIANEKGIRRRYVVQFKENPKTLEIQETLQKEQYLNV